MINFDRVKIQWNRCIICQWSLNSMTFSKWTGCLLLSSKHNSSFIYMSHRHRAMRWESSVLNWRVCLDRLDKYFLCVVVSSPLFGPDSQRGGSKQFKLHNIMDWVAVLSKTHGCLTSCLSVYTSPLALGINLVYGELGLCYNSIAQAAFRFLTILHLSHKEGFSPHKRIACLHKLQKWKQSYDKRINNQFKHPAAMKNYEWEYGLM